LSIGVSPTIIRGSAIQQSYSTNVKSDSSSS
jgi:hypothetical protein